MCYFWTTNGNWKGTADERPNKIDNNSPYKGMYNDVQSAVYKECQLGFLADVGRKTKEREDGHR
jgi:hypothetical protein